MGKGDGDPAIVSLVAWAESNGAVVQGVRLRGRRFYASEDLSEGHIVFSVPFSLLMSSNVAFKDEVYGPLLQEFSKAGASDQIVLTLFLALELAKGEQSFWAPFLAAIPSTFNTPLWFAEEDLVHIQGTKVAASLAKERTGLEQLVNFWGGTLLSTFKGNDYAYIERAMCWELLLWARTAVLSRGFNLMLNNERKEVLVPLFDMLDHSPSARVAWLTDEAQGVVHFACDDGLSASAEICNNYGQKPNDELLQGYGFCLYPNAADVFYIRIGLASLQQSTEADPQEGLKNLDSERRATATTRQELLWRMGVAAEYQLSLEDHMPKSLFFAAVLCLQPDSSAYLSTGIGWDLPTVSSPQECMATQMKVIFSLRRSLLRSARDFVGGSVADDCELLRNWGKQQNDIPPSKLLGLEREKCCLMYRLGQKEIVQASLVALESYTTVTLNGRLGDQKSQAGEPTRMLQHTKEIEANTKANTFGVDLYGLSECYSHEGSRPTLQLTKDFNKSELLVVISENIILCAKLAYDTAHSLSAALSKMKGLEESLVLRLLLLYEFGRGSLSPWASFIEELAYCMNSPVCFGSELLDALNGTGLGDNATDRLQDLQSQYENFMVPLQHTYPLLFPAKAGSQERWIWADIVIEECARRVVVSVESGDGSQTPATEETCLVLAPILSTLPIEFEGVMVNCCLEKSTGVLNVLSLCSLQAGVCLQIPSDEIDNEACLLQLRPASSRINNRNDVMELCIGVPLEDVLADEKEELLQASGLGTVHYLTKDPRPELLLAAVSLCFIDNSDALEACGASHLLDSVKNAKMAAAQAEEGWCSGANDGNQDFNALEERRSRARQTHALAAAAALTFVQKLQETSRMYKAVGTLRKLISATYANLDGGSAEEDEKLLQVLLLQQSTTASCEVFAIKAETKSYVDQQLLWRSVLAYRHGQKQIMEAWMSKLKCMLRTSKEKRGHTSHNTNKHQDRVKRKR